MYLKIETRKNGFHLGLANPGKLNVWLNFAPYPCDLVCCRKCTLWYLVKYFFFTFTKTVPILFERRKSKCKRHYCQLLLFRTLVIVAFDMCEKSFTSACIPRAYFFLLLPHTNIHRYTQYGLCNTASTKLPVIIGLFSVVRSMQ